MTSMLKARHDATVLPCRASIQSIDVPVAATSPRAQPRKITHHKNVRNMLFTSGVQYGRPKTGSRVTAASTGQRLMCSSRQLVWIHMAGCQITQEHLTMKGRSHYCGDRGPKGGRPQFRA